MTHASETSDGEEGRLDLVPLIDCVMLLLMFFILTSTFDVEERILSALLPEGGSISEPKPVSIPPPTVRIALLPGEGRQVLVRIGGQEAVTLDPERLASHDPTINTGELEGLHTAIAPRLQAYEKDGARTAQVPVEIHCATRLPWACALAVYVAVRAYEADRQVLRDVPIEAQRSVAFAAPTVRSTTTDNEAEELFRLRHLR